MPDASTDQERVAEARRTVLELRVRNHPGAMSHITGLFSRRAFNLEAILCVPDAESGGETSTMLLDVSDDPRLEQVEQQLRRLQDVLVVSRRPDLSPGVFQEILGRTRRMAEGPA